MHVFSSHPEFQTIYEAPRELMRKMHEGVSHSKKIKRARRKGIDAWDDKWKMRAKRLLDEAILSGEVDIYAEFVSEGPKKLSPARLNSAAC